VSVRAVGNSTRDLVVLMSDYTGWKLFIDGQPAAVRPVNGYLGAAMRSGQHDYRFVFRPRSYDVGLVISLLAVAAVCGLILSDLRGRSARPPLAPAD
jgi:uncharacterized membrane protein YfhO